MKREILYNRIAKKGGFPPLADILSGFLSPTYLPDECMIWTGRKTVAARRMKIARSPKNGRINIVQTENKSYPLIMVEGRNVTVHRFVYDQIFGLKEGDKLSNSCSSTLCVNPKHWRHINAKVPVSHEAPIEEPWTEDEVEQILDLYLIQHETIDLHHPDIAQIPQDLLVKVLDNTGMKHKCPVLSLGGSIGS